MINLLPPELKQSYSYARRNTSLRRWLFTFGFGLIGLAVITFGGTIYLGQTARQYELQADAMQQALEQQNQADVERKAKDISNSLKLAVQVLSKEVLFSKLLKQLAIITPAQASLSNLSITDLQSGVDLTAKTTDYTSATQLLVNLTDTKNQVFAKADIVSINCTSAAAGQGPTKYPCTVIIRAEFAKDNPFLFISNKTVAKK